MAHNQTFRYLPAGDRAIVVEGGDDISPDINRLIRAFALALEEQDIAGIREYIPTYCSLMILYDPGQLLFSEIRETLQDVAAHIDTAEFPEPAVVEVPVAYGGEFGPDIAFVAQHNNLSEEEVISLHTGQDYLVYMLGFTPGFCYLGGMPEAIATPRLSTPRTCIPAGSVGIAGAQTGVYPIDSPGGWQLIGRTPLRLFDPNREPAVLMSAGDYVRFVPIDEQEYERFVREQYDLELVEGI